MRNWFLTFVVAGFVASAALLHAQVGPSAPQLYEKGLNALAGTGASHNDTAAVDYFRKSASQGYPPAQVALGFLYDTGTIIAREPQQAADWYKKAALQDDRLGQWLLGRLIYNGDLIRDLNEAAKWLQKAAGHNDPFGQYLLGMIKLERQDYPQAAVWFRKAAMQGLPQAQQQLGLLLKQGQGVPLDKSEAYVWLLMSSEAGNLTVTNDLQALEGDLGTNQVEQAKSKAHELQQTATRAVVAKGCMGWSGEFNPVPSPPPIDLQSFCR